MKILYIHQHFSALSGSTGNRSYFMAKELISQGHEVLMLCGSYGSGSSGLNNNFKKGFRKGVVDGINVKEFKIDYSNHLSFSQRILRFLTFLFKSSYEVLVADFDLIVCTSTPLTVGIPGLIAKFIRRKQFVFEIRDLWPDLPIAMGVISNRPLKLFLRTIERLLYKSADRIIVLSPGMADGVKKIVPYKLIKVIPNGSTPELIPFNPKALHEKYKALDNLNCIFSGSLGQANGVQSILDCALELKNRNETRINFFIYGSGSERKSLESFIFKNNLTNVFINDLVPKEDLFLIFQDMHIGIQCLKNLKEFYDGTSPNKFFDYIANGLPVLINYPGWLANEIEFNKCGVLVEPDSEIEFASALQIIISNPKLLIDQSQNARRLSITKFNYNTLSKEWVNFVVSAHA